MLNFETWRDFFDHHAPMYLQNSFTQNSEVEAQFLWTALELEIGKKVLDVGCGVGRHAVLLAERGANVTGLDFSHQMLFEAARNAREKGVEVDWVTGDCTDFSFDEPFDAAYCVCEGGFGLIGHDEDPFQHDFQTLQNVSNSLKPGGWFLLNALNPYSQIRQLTDAELENGVFDSKTHIMRYMDQMDIPGGPVGVKITERRYFPPEIHAMMFHVGLELQSVWGGTAGDWGRRTPKLDEIELMYLAKKSPTSKP